MNINIILNKKSGILEGTNKSFVKTAFLVFLNLDQLDNNIEERERDTKRRDEKKTVKIFSPSKTAKIKYQDSASEGQLLCYIWLWRKLQENGKILNLGKITEEQKVESGVFDGQIEHPITKTKTAFGIFSEAGHFLRDVSTTVRK